MTFRGSRAAWALGPAFVLGIAVAHAQRVESVPQPLEDVGITEHLDDVVPLDVPLRDERGDAVTLGRYFVSGRPVILNLVYFRCPMLCGVVMDGMVRGLEDVDWKPGTDFQIVTVSIDPTDAPALATAKKQEYVARYGREGAATGWHFLTGDAESISKLADAVGFRYRYLEDRQQYAHAAAIFVLTPDGRLSRYLYGVRFEPPKGESERPSTDSSCTASTTTPGAAATRRRPSRSCDSVAS
jgi:protein SCO1/2